MHLAISPICPGIGDCENQIGRLAWLSESPNNSMVYRLRRYRGIREKLGPLVAVTRSDRWIEGPRLRIDLPSIRISEKPSEFGGPSFFHAHVLMPNPGERPQNSAQPRRLKMSHIVFPFPRAWGGNPTLSARGSLQGRPGLQEGYSAQLTPPSGRTWSTGEDTQRTPIHDCGELSL